MHRIVTGISSSSSVSSSSSSITTTGTTNTNHILILIWLITLNVVIGSCTNRGVVGVVAIYLWSKSSKYLYSRVGRYIECVEWVCIHRQIGRYKLVDIYIYIYTYSGIHKQLYTHTYTPKHIHTYTPIHIYIRISPIVSTLYYPRTGHMVCTQTPPPIAPMRNYTRPRLGPDISSGIVFLQ